MRRLITAIATLVALPAVAQQGDGTDETYRVSVVKPTLVEATPRRIEALNRPDGFSISVFAQDLKNPRIVAVSPAGHVYVSRREQGDVLLLKDEDGDGRADGAPVTVGRRAGAHGLAIHDGSLYIATVREVFIGTIADDGTVGPLRMIIDDLPDGGQHPNRTLDFGPDGQLYISVGSSCNACNETNPEHATLLQSTPDGKSRFIFAAGLRNTIGFAWHPETGELWGLDHGIDFLGDDVQPEELNRIAKGQQFGWPHVFGDGDFNPQSTPPGKLTKAQWKQMSQPMQVGYTAHAAPMQMVFYPSGGSFPERWHGDAFATMRGSWNREPASGYELVHIDFEDGRPGRITPFVTGFLTDGGRNHFARPVGLAVAGDGALLVSDDANGVIYRIAHDDASRSRVVPATAPADVMERQNRQGLGVPLALQREETATEAMLSVSTPAFRPDAPIPPKHSDYGDKVSPALAWQAVEGARSYAIIMEDPDAKPITPYVHWVAWNIPGTRTQLPEGLPVQHRLTEPDGMMQGTNSRGTPGYFGPRPPVGDPPHHYHFQVLALDAMLDIKPGSTRDEVLNAAKGHVIGKGQIIGTYQQAAEPLN